MPVRHLLPRLTLSLMKPSVDGSYTGPNHNQQLEKRRKYYAALVFLSASPIVAHYIVEILSVNAKMHGKGLTGERVFGVSMIQPAFRFQTSCGRNS
jgi:hypothetical protein